MSQAPTTAEKKKEARWLKLLTVEFIALFSLLILSVIAFTYALHLVFIRRSGDFDDAVFRWATDRVTPLRTDIMVLISFLGKHSFLIPANFVLLAFFIFKKNRRFSIRVVALALSSLSLMFLLKLSFQRPRPTIALLEQVRGFSFPSGHALMSMVFYGLIIYIIWHEVKRRWLRNTLIAFLILLIHLIGISRVYLRVHYASDIIAGFAVGFIWLLVSLWTISRIEKRRFAKKALAGTQ